jgi:hypothetical protein
MSHIVKRNRFSRTVTVPSPIAGADRRSPGRDHHRYRPALLALEDRRLLSTFLVTSTADNDDTGTLRSAVAAADSAASPSAIEFELGTAPATITLSLGQLVLSNTSASVAIYNGPGQGPVTVSGNDLGRVFQVDGGVTATITGLTISGGSTTGYGGAVSNAGTTTLSYCTISGSSGFAGGGLFNAGTLNLTACTVSGNSGAGSGGGLFNLGTANLTGCTINGNATSGAAGGTGGWYTSPSYGNTGSACGGGVFNHGTADLTDCTITGNTAFGGSGLFNYGQATLIACTIGGGGSGGPNDFGIFMYSDPNTESDLAMTDTLDLDGESSMSVGGAPLGPTTGSNNIGFNGLVGVLGNYGGPTQTIPLLPGNPGIGAGIAVAGVTTDQRGVTLPSTGIDIGAFQSQGFTLRPVAGSTPQSTMIRTNFADPLALTVTANDPIEPVAGGDVTFSLPSNGAFAILSGAGTAVVGADGVASVTAAANATPGAYTVTASAGGTATCEFALDNTISLGFSGVTNQTIAYGTPDLIVSGTLADGSQVPQGEDVAVTLDGVTQQAVLGSNGAFSTTFDTAGLSVSSSPYTISYAYTSDGTFASASTTSTLAVTQATPTITWPDPADITYGTALSATQLDATASVPGTFAYTPAAGTILYAGTGETLSVTFTPTDSTDYTDASASAAIDVSKATPTITWADPADITYGTALSATQLDATASAPGTFTYTLAAGTVLHAGTDQTLSVAFIPTDSTDYNSASAMVTIDVDKATPTITWANPADITYGTALGSTQLDATTSVPGTFTYTPAAGTILYAGADQTLSVAFTPDDTNDYNTTSASTTIDVELATPTIDWPDPADITYGTALSTTQLDATASTPGTFTYTPAAGTVLAVGANQTLSVTFAPTDTTDFTTASATATINIDKTTPTINWPDPTDITYGTALSAAQLDATASVPGTFTYTPALGAIRHAGIDQTLSVAFTPTDTSDYDATTGTTTIDVDKATPTITWPEPAEITYGTPLSALQLDATPSVPGSFTYTPAAGSVLAAGTNQTLSVAFTPTDTTDFTTASDTTTINVDRATPTIDWPEPADIAYGTALGSTQLDATTSVPGTFTYTPAAGTVLPIGAGQSLSVAFTPEDAADYTTASATATINVDKDVPVIAWAAPEGIVYGTALSAAQLDATASVPGTFTYSPALGAILDAGAGQTLSVTFTPEDETNSAPAVATTTIDVDKATPTLDLSDPGGRYDGSPFPASVTIAGSGSENAPAASLQDIAPTLTYYNSAGISLGSSAPSAAGTYTVVAVFPGNTNYAAVQTAAVPFTIAQGNATIALTASGSSAVYGQSVTFVATVAPTAAGTVTFSDGGTPLATVSLDGSGTATLTTSGLALGSQSITATYSGDADFLGGQSGSASESVARASTAIVLAPQPVFQKKSLKSVGLTAEIAPIAPGGGVPTGAVTFELVKKTRKKTKVTTLGTVPLSGGDATLTVKPHKVLKKSLTIIYDGDTNHLASTLTPTTLTKKALEMLAKPTSDL